MWCYHICINILLLKIMWYRPFLESKIYFSEIMFVKKLLLLSFFFSKPLQHSSWICALNDFSLFQSYLLQRTMALAGCRCVQYHSSLVSLGDSIHSFWIQDFVNSWSKLSAKNHQFTWWHSKPITFELRNITVWVVR